MSSAAEAGVRVGGARCRRAIAALVCVALLGGLAGAETALAADSAVIEAQQPSAAEVQEYWTPQRMRNAQPIEHRIDAPSRRTLGGQAEPVRRSAQPSDSDTFPGRTHGKVFFTLPDGDFMCSGTVVRSGGRNLVITAGHCVYDDLTRRWATKWAFVPGYRDGHEPHGRWVAQTLATTSQWVSNADEAYDVGTAALRRDPNGRGVEDVIGALGIAFNQSRNQFYQAFGYPATGRFDGKRLYRCDSPSEGADHRFPPPQPIRIDCDMTEGSSGGGWVVDGGTVLSVTSYAYERPPDVVCDVDPEACPERDKLFGPFFGTVIRDLYRASYGRELRCGGRTVDHRGTAGRDQLVGTMGPDVIHGRGGADVLRGRAGNDVICGGPGNDVIFGGPGNNRIFAGPGNDRVLVRSRGRNRVVANRGRNRIRCGPGRDVVRTNHRSRVHRSCNRVIRR